MWPPRSDPSAWVYDSRVRLPAVLVICGVGTAFGEPPTSPIRDTNYSIELYEGTAVGNVAVVGMGGATIAHAIGTAGTLYNPSALAVRLTTDNDSWSWDYHIDYLNSSLSNDHDNNGFTEAGGASMLTNGLGVRIGDWAGAITLTASESPVDARTTLPDMTTSVSAASTLRFQLAVAHWLSRLDTAIGVALTSGFFEFGPLFRISGTSAEAGATWVPRGRSFRVGTSLRMPIKGDHLDGCLPPCQGWILPEYVVSPWRLATGVAYRWARTPWNQLVDTHFRDERAVTIVADVYVTGPSANAYGLGAFADQLLQRSGRHTSVSLRGGVEYEWIPGRLRVRGGSYWEPGRFVGVPGRLHATFGIELRLLEFWFWGKPRRGRVTLTSDIAERYHNGGLSLGFWH